MMGFYPLHRSLPVGRVPSQKCLLGPVASCSLTHSLPTRRGFESPLNSKAPLTRGFRADDGIRTHDINLGKVALYH